MKLSSIVFSAFIGNHILVSSNSAADTSRGLRGMIANTFNIDMVNNDRNLLSTINVDTITVCLQPVLSVAIGGALSVDLDPLTLGLTVTKALDSVKFSDTCTTSATLNIKVVDLSGLGTCNLHDGSFVALDDSEDIQCAKGLLGLGGCNWSVDLEAEIGFFGGLESLVEVEIVADACGTPIKKTVSGAVVALDAMLKLALETSGSTGSVLTLKGSDAKAAVKSDIDLALGAIKTNVPLDLGLGLEDFGLLDVLDEVLCGCAGQIVQVIANTLNEKLCVLHLDPIVRTSPMTAGPTRQPTKSPTKGPSKSPTPFPTRQPTKIPTTPPSRSPTFTPTKRPSVPPTPSPSMSPTKLPTPSPTTLAPTASPTTTLPTLSPTESPTSAPTSSPTARPTEDQQLVNIDVDTITLCLQHVLSLSVAAALSADLDPLAIDLVVTKDLDSVKFSDTCTASAILNIKVIDLSGFGTCNLFDGSFVAVDDSEDIQCSSGILGLGGCDWSIDMEAEVGFQRGLESLVEIEIVADACGSPIQKTVSGAVVALDASLKLALDTSGSTGSLLSLEGSDAKAAVKGNIDLALGEINTNVPLDLGLGVEDFGLLDILDEVLCGCANQLVPIIVESLNDKLCVLDL